MKRENGFEKKHKTRNTQKVDCQKHDQEKWKVWYDDEPHSHNSSKEKTKENF